MAGSAWSNPYTFVPYEILTAAKVNAMQDNLRALKVWTTRGDILYGYDADQLERLAIGLDGQQLTSLGGVPVWRNLIPTRQGGSATVWSTGGTTNYSISGKMEIAIGAVSVTASTYASGIYWGSDSVTFPTAYSYSPILIASMEGGYGGTSAYVSCSITSSGATFYFYSQINTTTRIQWMAIGPVA